MYAEFTCIAAPPGASPPAQCANRKATFYNGNDSWQLASDTGWVVTDVNVANCVYKHVPITFHIKRVRTDKRGGAKLTIHVPGTGRLDLTGNGIKHAKATPQNAGTVTMAVAATGSKRQKLDRTGSVKVKARIKFQPYFGDGQPSSQSRKIKLHE